MVCHRNCCSKIIIFGILYVAIGCNLSAQTAPTRSKAKKKQTEKNQSSLSRRDSLSIENKKLRISYATIVKDSLPQMETVYENGIFKQIPRTLDRKSLPSISDSLIPFKMSPSSLVNQKERVLLEYRKNMNKTHKLGEKIYKINPNAFKPTPGNIKVEGAPQDFETIYDGGHFKQAAKSGNASASAPMPAFIVGGTKEVSKKDKRILKDVYDIEVK